MRARLFCLGMLLFLLTSCAAEKPRQLPKFISEPPQSLHQEQRKVCESVYPEGRWQFVHSVEFTMADGAGSTVIGVTVLDGNEISCALMTIEGFTLFEARYTGRLKVIRAVPPFDKPAFAAGLMNDVRAIFVRPAGKDVRYGRLRENPHCCRIIAADGRVTDIMPSANGCWRINTYNNELIKTRTIVARSCRTADAYRIPGELELTVPGPAGYTLKMTLLSAEKIHAAAAANQKHASR
ncbi:hypothetical protein BMS3Bbin14_02201 [bacterium BMS3Bbin14]|nr:hypothetical protein BMS3Abin13_00244 [bacterium BMS3Abin13]GBE53699.1 hypothetical protein BMS3Bbin14_02201 [bacterium BMS3Bbin14]HDO29745.1 hypothetical protein [Desulfobacteraceae bacterium]